MNESLRQYIASLPDTIGDDRRSLNRHQVNNDLAQSVVRAARAKGMGVTRYSTCFKGWAGVHRYAIYMNAEAGRPFGTRSSRVVYFWETPYSRYAEPSISGEATCLRHLLSYLEAPRD